MTDSPVPPTPSLSETFRWADGDLIGDDYRWMSEIESFEYAIEEADEPREVLVERWERIGYEVRWVYPTLYACVFDGGDCGDEAVVWHQYENGSWAQLCEKHRPTP